MKAADFFGPYGALAKDLPGFEHREGQVQMAERVECTLKHDGALMVEAGTGIGKSFAYLVPALLSGKKVVISTATKNLQDQLFHKDLPKLQEILGSKVPAARMKGRENYLCRLEWGQFTDGRDAELPISKTRAADIERVAKWAETTKTGDFDEVPGVQGPLDFRRGISTISENCIGRRCDHHNDCHLTTLREEAQGSQILIVNHALLVADLIVRQNDYGEVLPKYKHLIVDEAHRLQDAATMGFSVTLSSAAAERLTTELNRFLKRVNPDASPPPAGAKLRRAFKSLFELLAPEREGEPRIFDPAHLDGEVHEWRTAVSTQLDALDQHLQELNEKQQSGPLADGSEGEHGAVRFLKRVADLRVQVHALLEPRPDFVHSSKFGREPAGRKTKKSGGRTCFVTAAPIEPGNDLRQNLFGSLKSCVLTSATLALDGGFGYAAEAIGVETTDSAIIPSPFSFEDQSRLYVPRDLVPPNDIGFAKAMAVQVLDLLVASRGRALLLFTSWSNLGRVASELERAKRELGPDFPYPLLRQQPGGGHAALLDRFRKTPNAVLLGTRSFWEGVDVRGEALTLLVIDKLPFPVFTEPLHKKRQERAYEATGDGFNNYSVPQTALALKQGLGRLIRSQDDVGLAAVFDSRLVQKAYGRRVIESLPGFPLVTELREATEFLEALP